MKDILNEQEEKVRTDMLIREAIMFSIDSIKDDIRNGIKSNLKNAEAIAKLVSAYKMLD